MQVYQFTLGKHDNTSTTTTTTTRTTCSHCHKSYPTLRRLLSHHSYHHHPRPHNPCFKGKTLATTAPAPSLTLSTIIRQHKTLILRFSQIPTTTSSFCAITMVVSPCRCHLHRLCLLGQLWTIKASSPLIFSLNIRVNSTLSILVPIKAQ